MEIPAEIFLEMINNTEDEQPQQETVFEIETKIKESSEVMMKSKSPITWTDNSILKLCREVGFVNPFQYKERTKERGTAWEVIARNLNSHGLEVSKRQVRDKFKSLKEGIMKRNKEEAQASGIAPESTVVDQEVTRIVEDLEVEEDVKQKQKKKELDGVEMRKRALETFAETNKRTKSDKEVRRRNTGSGLNEFLMKRVKEEGEFKEREFELRKKQIEQRDEYERKRREREEREDERRRQEEERRREREEREQERREREEERRRLREERDEERRRLEASEREKRMELMQQQILQQNQLIMLLLKKKED